MAKDDQGQPGTASPDQQIEVNLDADDPSKTIIRVRAASEIASQVRDESDPDKVASASETKLVKGLRRRLGQMQRTYDQRSAEAEARHQREIADLGARVDKLGLDRRDGAGPAAEAAHEAAMKDLRTQLEAAIERGDSAKQADITFQINRAEAKYWADKANSAGVAQREPAKQAATTERAVATGPTAAGSRFIVANEDWWEDPDFALERSYANQLFTLLTGSEGFDKNDDETFREIARRVKGKFPSLEIKAGRDDPEADEGDEGEQPRAQPNGKRRPHAGATSFQDRGAAGAANGRRGRRTIMPAEQKTMREAGMDPNNDAHVMQWIKEAEALERSGQ